MLSSKEPGWRPLSASVALIVQASTTDTAMSKAPNRYGAPAVRKSAHKSGLSNVNCLNSAKSAPDKSRT